MFVTQLVIVNTATHVYQFFIDKYLNNRRYFSGLNNGGLVLCVNSKSSIAHMVYGLTFSNCTDAPILLIELKYYPSSDNGTPVFS